MHVRKCMYDVRGLITPEAVRVPFFDGSRVSNARVYIIGRNWGTHVATAAVSYVSSWTVTHQYFEYNEYMLQLLNIYLQQILKLIYISYIYKNMHRQGTWTAVDHPYPSLRAWSWNVRCVQFGQELTDPDSKLYL